MTFRPWAGFATIETWDARSGELIERIQARNAYTNVAARDYASALGGSAVTLTVSHIDTGLGNVLSLCESTSGWTGSPVLDNSIYREGAGALKGSASASGSAVYYHATSSGGTVNIGTGGTAEFAFRLTTRSATDLTGSQLRLYSGSTADWRYITLTDAETATGLTLADTTWTRLSIPVSAAGWTTGAGTPSWTSVTGIGVVVKASGSGTAVAHWDQVVGLGAIGTAASTIATLTATPGSRGVKAVTELSVSGGTVTAAATWASTEGVGDISWVGLYGKSGSTLIACAPMTTFYKSASVVMTIRWTATVAGG